jgi:hypothetical protein
VNTLSGLRIFHFPYWAPSSSESGGNDNDRSESTLKWPDSLETFHIPRSLHMGYILAFEKVPASLKSLIIKDDGASISTALDTVFDLLGPQILALKVEYDDEESKGQLSNILNNFPHLLHLSVRPYFIGNSGIYAQDQIMLEIDHPLCSITIDIEHLDQIVGDNFTHCLASLVDHNRLPNIRSFLSSSNLSVNQWASILRLYYSRSVIDVELLHVGSYLKRRSSSESGPEESRLWLVDGEDNDATICEIHCGASSKYYR